MITLTKSERQIMEIIWHADHPMAQGEVVAACKWKSRSIFSMLNSLMEKGLLKATGYERSGKHTFEKYSFVYSHVYDRRCCGNFDLDV